MTQATLRTSRITLVPLSDDHLEYEVELDSDPEVMRYLGNGRARSRAEVEAFHARRLASAESVPGLGFWAGFVKDDFVGWWLLEPPHREDQKLVKDQGLVESQGLSQRQALVESQGLLESQALVENQAELGYRLLRRYWRQGLASEGARELIRHGFEDLGLTRIFAETMEVNTASRATMSSLGMHYIRTFEAPWEPPIPGLEPIEVEYALTRDQWLKATGQLRP